MSQEQAQQFLDQAIQSIQGGQFAQALELLNQAIELHPEHSEAHVLKGVALSQLKQPEAAVDAFRKAIMLSPYNVKAYYNLAVHYYGVGEKVKAEEMAREAVRVDPRHAGARDLLGRIEGERAPTEVGTKPAEPGSPGQGTAVPPVAPPSGVEVLGPRPHELPRQPETHAVPSQPLESPPPGTATRSPAATSATPPGGYVPPSTPLPGGYYRQGYETRQVHSLNFVETMGEGWTRVGWALAIVGTVVFLGSLVATISMWGAIVSNANQSGDLPAMFGGNDLLTLILGLVGSFIQIATLVWMILELVDRRGNWLWLIPFLLCCCTGLQGPLVMIYLLKGRE